MKRNYKDISQNNIDYKNSQHHKDYKLVDNLYKEKDYNEVSRLVKEREVSKYFRDVLLLGLSAKYNHTSLIEAITKIPDVVNNFSSGSISNVAKLNQRDVLTRAFNNMNENIFVNTLNDFRHKNLDQKVKDTISISIGKIENVSKNKMLSTYKFNPSYIGQSATLNMIDKLNLNDTDKENIYLDLNKNIGLKGFEVGEENLIAKRIKEEISDSKSFSEDTLFNIALDDFDFRSKDNSLAEFILENNNNVKERMKQEQPRIHDDLIKKNSKDNVMSF